MRIVINRAGGPDALKAEEARRPRVPAGHLLVENRYAAVNFIDTLIRRGAMPAGAMPDLPHVPGVEGAGVVDTIGPGVTGYSPGEVVAWMGRPGAGGYGRYSLVPPHAVARLAATTPPAEAAGLPVNAVTAWQLLVKIGRVEPGETVLVRAAAGGVGTMLVQLAKLLGARVVAVCSKAKLPFIREQGADHAIAYDADDVGRAVMAITDDRGVDIACNPVGGATVASDLACLAPFGRLLIYGFLAGEPQGSFASDLVPHFGKSVGLHVSDVYTLYDTRPDVFASALAEAVGLLEAGVLRPRLHAVLPLRDASQAHEMIESGDVAGKIVLEVGP